MTANGGGGGLRASRASGGQALERLAGAGWDRLLAARPPTDPLRRIAWLDAWLDEVGPGVRPACVIVDRGRVPVAASPLETASRGGLRVVRHLGQGDAWFDIEPPAADEAALHTLLTAVAAEPGDILMLDGFSADETTLGAVRDAIPRVRLDVGETWRLTIAEPPRPMRKRRKEAGRARRRGADRGITLSTRWLVDWAEIAPRVGALLDFHAAHFPGDGVNLLAAPGARRRLAERSIAAMGAEGRARLGEVHIDGGPLVAWDLAFVGDGGGAVAYSGAFDRSREDVTMLGWISMLSMVEALGEEGVEVVDFGPGPAPYKTLIASSVPLVRATAPLSRRGQAALGAHRLVTAVRRRRAGREAQG